jgi:hypothetical protein
LEKLSNITIFLSGNVLLLEERISLQTAFPAAYNCPKYKIKNSKKYAGLYLEGFMPKSILFQSYMQRPGSKQKSPKGGQSG